MPRPKCPPPSSLKLYLIGPIVFAVWVFVTDLILFGFVAKEFFAVPGMKDPPDAILNIIGVLVGGLLFCYIYMFYARCPNVDAPEQVSEVTKGWHFGVLLALAIFLPAAIIYPGFIEGWSVSTGIVETIYRVVQFLIAGIFVAKILK